jgi:hypothetical protein
VNQMNSEHGSSLGAANKVEIYPSRGRLVLLGFVSLLFVWLGLWMEYGSESSTIPMWQVVVARYPSVAFFRIGLIYAAYRLMARRPALVLSLLGIIDEGSAVSAGLVRWEEIDLIFTGSIQRRSFVSMAVKTPDRFLERMGGRKAKLVRTNLGLVGAPVNIPVDALSMTVGEILRKIQEFRTKHRA